jgi:hypothetical protein
LFLDWFVNTEFNSVSIKRKKLEEIELKQQTMLDKIVAKKNKLNEAHFKLANTYLSADSKGCLKLKPTDGTPFYEVANPDCSLVGYVEVSRPNETSKSRRVLTPSSHLIDSILNSVAPAIPTVIFIYYSSNYNTNFRCQT